MRRGFTIIELLASMVVMSVLGTLGSVLLLNAADGYTDAVTRTRAHADLSVTFDRIVREVRSIGLDDGASGVAPDIDRLTPELLRWRDSDDEVWQITLTGTNLTLAADGGAPAVLLGDVSDVNFVAYGDTHDTLAASLNGNACDDIRRIGIEVEVTRDGLVESLRTLVYLRGTLEGGEASS